MTAENSVDSNVRSVGLFIDGATDPDVGADGTPMVDNDFLVLINAWWEPLTFTVPADLSARQWSVVCDTHDPERSDAVGHAVAVGLGQWSSCCRRPKRRLVTSSRGHPRMFGPASDRAIDSADSAGSDQEARRWHARRQRCCSDVTFSGWPSRTQPLSSTGRPARCR